MVPVLVWVAFAAIAVMFGTGGLVHERQRSLLLASSAKVGMEGMDLETSLPVVIADEGVASAGIVAPVVPVAGPAVDAAGSVGDGTKRRPTLTVQFLERHTSIQSLLDRSVQSATSLRDEDTEIVEAFGEIPSRLV
jgi:hypothetical protein